MPKPTELEDFIGAADRPDATDTAKACLRLIRSNPIITPKVFSLIVGQIGGDLDNESMQLRLYQELNTFLVQAHTGVPDLVRAAQKMPRESWERQGYARV
jgi:hypothetical protein